MITDLHLISTANSLAICSPINLQPSSPQEDLESKDSSQNQVIRHTVALALISVTSDDLCVDLPPL
jgi:hypothetical protein